MRTRIPCAIAFIALFSSSISEIHAQTNVSPVPRLLVVPLDNRSGQQTQNYLSLALAGTLAESLEPESAFKTLNGPLIMTAEQAILFAGLDDLLAAAQLAKSKGAEYLVTGSFSGKTWDWQLSVEIYALDEALPKLIGYGEAKGSQMAAYKKAGGRTVQIVRMNNILDLLAAATEQAFDQSGLIISAAALDRLRRPATEDAYAYQLLARAQDRYFNTGRIRTDKTALEIAEHAVLVDPAHAEAQRFYAFLLDENDLPKKALIHYEQALAKKPTDVRSLIALGALSIKLMNFEEARGYLIRAVNAWPQDSTAHYWLALAKFQLGDKKGAVASFERSRDADPSNLDPRRELVRLYSTDHRYADAVRELTMMTGADPGDRQTAFLLAACLRADGRTKEAAETYENMARRFNDARPWKFRGDMLVRLGDPAGALAAYKAARALAPNDHRLRNLPGNEIAGKGEPQLPAEYLVDAFGLVDRIGDGTSLEQQMAEAREMFRFAANDALMELSLRGKNACAADGTAAATAVLAYRSGQTYLELGRRMNTTAAILASAGDRGEDAALTTDEYDEMRRLTGSLPLAATDLSEMRAEYRNALLPLLRLNGCPERSEPAEAGAVLSRNLDRRVNLPEVRPPQYPSAISPQISPDRARTVIFTIDNTAGANDYLLVIDQHEIGRVPAGRAVNFTASVGRHAFCLLPPDRKCGDPGTVRWVFLHDGWTMVVKPAQ